MAVALKTFWNGSLLSITEQLRTPLTVIKINKAMFQHCKHMLFHPRTTVLSSTVRPAACCKLFYQSDLEDEESRTWIWTVRAERLNKTCENHAAVTTGFAHVQNQQSTSPTSTWLRMFHTSHRHNIRLSSSDFHGRVCWNCGRDTSPKTELFFCHCGVVQQPAGELTYFTLMQMEQTYDVDVKKLGEIFRETQKRLHPDKFSTKSKEEVDLAQQQSSLLNKAYNTLLKPLSRAIYMLELNNIEISEHDNFSDPSFLMEIMEINEQISSAKKPEEVQDLETQNDEKIAKCVHEISELFKKKLLNDAKNATIQLRYYTTIQERINELKRNNLDGNIAQ